MKRDMDLIRELLFEIEKHEHGYAPKDYNIEGHSDEEIGFHFHLMGEAGLLKVADVNCRGLPSPQAMPISITSYGYDFLEASKNNDIWNEVKDAIAKKGVGLTIDVVMSMLIAYGKAKLGLSGE